MSDQASPRPDTRVLIVEDHKLIADGLTALISDEDGMTVVGHFNSVAESAQHSAEVPCDIVLIDFHLGDGSGADAAKIIRRTHHDARFIFLTREESDAARWAALEVGASAFIHKSRAAEEVIGAIRRVALGESLITPNTIATLFSQRRKMESQIESLSPREMDVLRLMAQGVSSHDMAGKLGISYSTIRTHIRSLASKLGVHSKLEAVAKAGELGLLER